MSPRMTIRSTNRSTAAPQCGRTGRRTGRGSGRTKCRTGDQGSGGIDEQGGQVGGQGNEVNDSVDRVHNFSTIIAQQLQNLLPTIVAQLGNHGNNYRNNRNQNGNSVNDNIQGELSQSTDVGMAWEDFKTSMRDEFCLINEMQKLETEFWNHAMIGAGHAAYPDRFHELARLVPHLVTPENKRIERNGSLKKNHEKRWNGGEPSKDMNIKDDNKMTRNGNAFTTTANPVRREYTGAAPKCTSISLPPKVEVERLLAMPTLSPSPLTSLSPPSAGEYLARCTAPTALPSPPLPPSLYPPPVDHRDDIPKFEQPPVRQSQIVETLRVMRDMRREIGDIQAELLALCGQPRRARQPG
nr:reverse transcriptase domain-containing protein [Tanacetum cinerariifolium]